MKESSLSGSFDLSWLSEESIRKTSTELGPFIDYTPVWPLRSLSIISRIEIIAKLELFQRTGSFKARGAFNVIRQLSEAELSRGVTAVSGGNHAVAVAYAAQNLGTSAKVVMPRTANARRRELCQQYGAEVFIESDIRSAFERAETIAREERRHFVHPFEGQYTILGTATVGMEILDQVPQADAVVVPIGGGGLCAGIASAIKLLMPDCRIYGVEPEGSAVMHRSIANGRVERLEESKTIADSLAAPITGPLCLELCRRYVDKLVTVSDAEMKEAMKHFLLEAKLAVEPAGASALAAVLGPLRSHFIGEKVVVLVCGSNIDVETFRSLIGT